MFWNKKLLINRVGFELKIAAILFLFVLVWLATVAGAVRKTALKHRSPVFSASLKADSAKTAQSASSRAKTFSSSRDASAAKPVPKDGADSAHFADSGSAKKGRIRVDTGTSASSMMWTDSSRIASAAASADSGVGSRVAALPAVDSVVSMSASMNKPIARPASVKVPVARGSIGALLTRIAIILFSILVIVAAFVFARKLRSRMNGQRFLTTTRLSVMDKEVQRACRYIELHFSEPDCNPKVVCVALTTGERFLEVLMERNLGIGIAEFITHVRINGARRMLEKDPAASKDTVARASGFTDIRLFEEAFLKAAGVTFDTFLKR